MEKRVKAADVESVSVPEAGRILQLAPATVRGLIERGHLRAWLTSAGGDYRIRIVDIDAYIEAQFVQKRKTVIPPKGKARVRAQ